jgi:hypothetical protein
LTTNIAYLLCHFRNLMNTNPKAAPQSKLFNTMRTIWPKLLRTISKKRLAGKSNTPIVWSQNISLAVSGPLKIMKAFEIANTKRPKCMLVNIRIINGTRIRIGKLTV